MEGTCHGGRTVSGGQPSDTANQQDVRRMPRRNNWSAESDETLVNLLTEACAGIKPCSGSFRPEVWVRVWNAYKTKTNEDITLAQLKSRWKTLKKLYRTYLSLVNKSGWSWDYQNHQPTPGDPTVWDDIIKVNKEYKVARDKPFPLFKKIHDLAGPSTASGMYATHTGGSMYTSFEVMDLEEGTDSSENPVQELDADTFPGQRAGKQVKNSGASGPNKRKRTHGQGNAMTSKPNTDKTIECVNRLVELTDRKSRITEQRHSRDDSCHYDECMDKLMSLPNLTDEGLCVGMEVLKNRENRSFFMKARLSAVEYWLSLRVKEFQLRN